MWPLMHIDTSLCTHLLDRAVEGYIRSWKQTIKSATSVVCVQAQVPFTPGTMPQFASPGHGEFVPLGFTLPAAAGLGGQHLSPAAESVVAAIWTCGSSHETRYSLKQNCAVPKPAPHCQFCTTLKLAARPLAYGSLGQWFLPVANTTTEFPSRARIRSE